MARFAFVGFGDLGGSLAEGLASSGRHQLCAYARPRSNPAAAEALARRLERAGVRLCPTLAEAVADAQAVLAVVPGSASLEVAAQCAPLLPPGAYYVDFSAAAVEDKRAGAEAVEGGGALYVDVAVLGTVSTSGFRVPMLASGRGANGWRDLVEPEGLQVEAIEAPAGDATLVKLLRSVYMKGRDALILEMMTAARRYGLHERVAESIKGPGEQVPFPALAERVLCALAVHAGRRADELALSGQVVEAAGVEPRLSRAGAESLRAMAALKLKETFASERPADAEHVLSAMEELTAEGVPPAGEPPLFRPRR